MPHRPPATLAIVPALGRQKGHEQLRGVEAELSGHDNLVVLRSGLSRTAALWRTHQQGGWRAPQQVPSAREVFIFLEEGVLASKGWVEELLEVFLDEAVLAAAPRTNVADGEELLIGVPYRPYEPNERASFLADVTSRDLPPARRATHLDGPCLALRRELLDQLGGMESVARQGFDPAFLAAAAAAQGELAIAERAYLHHPGGLPGHRSGAGARPFISACMIVKDEEANLPRSLASLAGVADEIVVYDTGSSDRSVEVAEEFGARVFRGHWDEDFSRARNAALEHCGGQWVLWLDADEAVVCSDPSELAAHLRALSSEVEGELITIDNLRGTETATTLSHPACRIFRRASGHWDGRVHEQVVARRGSRDLAIVPSECCRITHWGYVQAAVAGRDKGVRNLRTAFGDLAGGSELDLGERLTSLGRSYLMAGRLEEGLEITRQAIATAGRPSTERLARRALIEGLLAAGRHEEALIECELLAAQQVTPTIARAHAGSALLALGRYEEAIASFDQVLESVDDDGFAYEASFVAAPRAEALAALGRHDEAATLLLDTLARTGGLDAHLGLLAECLGRAGRSLQELARAIPSERARDFVPQLLQLRPEAADDVLEAWTEVDPDSLAVLAAAARLATRLPIARQLVWSTRLRARGLGASCPLVISSTETGIEPTHKVIAAAAAVLAFADPRARLALTASLLGLEAAARPEVLAALASFAPALAELAESLRPAEAPTRPARLPAAPVRSVLVVCRGASELRAFSLAARLAAHGHEVTLLQPQPAAPAEALLAPHRVRVHGWVEREDWAAAARAFIAHLSEQGHIDAVILGPDGAGLIPELRKFLPVADFVLDLGDHPVPPGVAAALTLRGVHGPGAHEAVLEDDLGSLYGELAPTPVAARSGVVVLANLRERSDAAEAFLADLAPLLASAPYPVALHGDDPQRRLAAMLPEAIVLGAPADPTPWLRAARAVLVVTEDRTGAYAALAARCGTPVLRPGAGEDAGSVLARLEAHLADATSAMPPPITTSSPQTTADFTPDPLARLAAPWQPAQGRGGRRVGLRGGVFGHDSLATVNRELALRLARRQDLELSVLTEEVAPHPEDSRRALQGVRIEASDAPSAFDVEIRHSFPPNFAPADGRLVLIQPWEFGGLPAEWIGPLRDVVDELWVPTHFVRDCALASGVAPEKVHVVPNGVDTDRFSPEGPGAALATKKSLKLLFVGGLIERKGVDALLEAYCATFSRADDVCLVIKPFGSSSVYRNSTLEPTVRRLAAGSGPEIELVEEDLSASQMAELYRACDALVLPYRGEGFGLPIAEAMACGLPVVVPDGGACLDFCDEEVAWMVPARQVPIAPSEWTPSNAGSWWLEPSRSGLSAALAEVVAKPELRARRGEAARRRIVERFTWQAAAEVAAGRLEALLGGPASAAKSSDSLLSARNEARQGAHAA